MVTQKSSFAMRWKKKKRISETTHGTLQGELSQSRIQHQPDPGMQEAAPKCAKKTLYILIIDTFFIVQKGTEFCYTQR
jgi:hypothetical protein